MPPKKRLKKTVSLASELSSTLPPPGDQSDNDDPVVAEFAKAFLSCVIKVSVTIYFYFDLIFYNNCYVVNMLSLSFAILFLSTICIILYYVYLTHVSCGVSTVAQAG